MSNLQSVGKRDEEPRGAESPATEKSGEKRKRARDEMTQIKTPQLIQKKKKKIRPKVVREGKRKPSTKKASATVAEVTYVTPKRSSRRSLRFDSDEQEEDGLVSEDLQNTMGILSSNIPKRKRGSNTNKSASLFQTMFWLQFPDIHRKRRTNGSQVYNNLKRKRTSRVTQPRHFQSLKKALTGIIDMKGSNGPPQLVKEMIKSFVFKKKRRQRQRDHLDLQKSKGTSAEEEQKALMPYKKDGSLLPKPKVNLDAETIIVSKLLKVSIESEGVDGRDEETKKWWKEERSLLEARARSFNDSMHFVLGNRQFLAWKGSVVDSVVGVFLTQNVTDRASSTAFMDIAAEFPIDWSPNPNCIIVEEIDCDEDKTMLVDPPKNSVETTLDVEMSSSQSSNLLEQDTKQQSCGNSMNEVPLEVEKGGDKSSQVKRKKRKIVKNKKRRKKPTSSKLKGRARTKKKKENNFDWDSLRKEAESGGQKRERTDGNMDSVDWDALRCTSVKKIAAIIRKRGMNKMLSQRIKDFLNRLVQNHGSIDLEWLRNVVPDEAKKFLMSINGLGLKSVECVRLLSLHQIAFPVDTNVARITVRLGWVPLQPLPDELQMHLLELYPVLDSIQKYLWPRLCKLDHETLYKLHYNMITLGKVFCTKRKPNCNACPLKAECKHYASARASARVALPEPEERRSAIVNEPKPVVVKLLLTQDTEKAENSDQIIEEAGTPEAEYTELHDIEDYPWDNNNEIPTIMLKKVADMSRALVVLSPQAASRPTRKLKKTEKLRTEHIVYELPDSHEILQREGFEQRDPDDKVGYLLAIWTPGETPNSIKPPIKRCECNTTLCNKETCLSCNTVREDNSQIVRGTILIPCRSAMRGNFPLNGTYFQTNEVFADHETSINPIHVQRKSIWHLERRIAYFGSSVSASFGGLSVEAIQYSFWNGYVCVRGFNRKNREPQPLVKRLHCPPTQKNQEDED